MPTSYKFVALFWIIEDVQVTYRATPDYSFQGPRKGMRAPAGSRTAAFVYTRLLTPQQLNTLALQVFAVNYNYDTPQLTSSQLSTDALLYCFIKPFHYLPPT